MAQSTRERTDAPKPRRGGSAGRKGAGRKAAEPPAAKPEGREAGPQRAIARREAAPPAFPAFASPFQDLHRLSDEVDRILGGILRGFGLGGLPSPRMPRAREAAFSPAVDVLERDGKLVVRADLPGLRKEDVKVEIDRDALTIEGQRAEEREQEEAGWYQSECRYGYFVRQVPLPPGVSPEDARAVFRDGVLEVTVDLPEPAARGRQRIAVTGEGEEPPTPRRGGRVHRA